MTVFNQNVCRFCCLAGVAWTQQVMALSKTTFWTAQKKENQILHSECGKQRRTLFTQQICVIYSNDDHRQKISAFFLVQLRRLGIQGPNFTRTQNVDYAEEAAPCVTFAHNKGEYGFLLYRTCKMLFSFTHFPVQRKKADARAVSEKVSSVCRIIAKACQ